MRRPPLRDELALVDIPGKGKGVVACRPFLIGERLLCFQGPLLPIRDVASLDGCLQVSEELCLASSGELDDYVNHSCRPNCGVYEELEGPVLRPILPVRAGEEVCFDYSTWSMGGHWRMPCRCRSPICRGTVDDFGTVDPVRRRRYLALGCVPAFVRRSLSPHRGSGPPPDECRAGIARP